MIRVVVVALSLCIGAAQAWADPATADKLAAEATDLVGKGAFRAAAAKFAEAYRADRSKLDNFCNIGISYYKAEDYPRAHLLLKLCLDRNALDKGFVEKATPVIAAIEDTLRAGGHAQVTVSVAPDTTAIQVAEWGKEETFVGGRVIWLPVGTWHLESSSEGFETQRTEVKVESTDKQTVAIAMKKLPVVAPRSVEKERSKLPPILTTVAASGALVVAVIGFKKGHDAADVARFAVDNEALTKDKSEVTKWNSVLVIGGVAAIAGGVVSGYLWKRASKKDRIEIQATGGSGAVSYTRRF